MAARDDVSSTWRKPSEHDDVWAYCWRKAAFPLVSQRPRVILFAWAIIFAVSVATGPAFLEMTQSDFTLPTDTPSYTAVRTFATLYPTAHDLPPVFIVQSGATSLISGPGGNATTRVSAALQGFARTEGKGFVDSITGYWELSATPGLALLADRTISVNKLTMVSTVNFNSGTEEKKVQDFTKILATFAENQSGSVVNVAATGL